MQGMLCRACRGCCAGDAGDAVHGDAGDAVRGMLCWGCDALQAEAPFPAVPLGGNLNLCCVCGSRASRLCYSTFILQLS